MRGVGGWCKIIAERENVYSFVYIQVCILACKKIMHNIIGPPVTGEDFFGREKEIQYAWKSIKNGNKACNCFTTMYYSFFATY